MLSASLLLAAPVAAQQTDTTQVHVVRPGDTLWDLARRYLNDPYLWPEIFRLNRDAVENPNWIYPAERLRIPGSADPAGEPTEVTGRREPGRTVFYGTDQPTQPTSTLRLLEEVPRPAVMPGDYYRAGLLIPEGQLQPLGRLVELVSPSVVPVEIPRQITQYDRAYMTIAGQGSVRVGDRLHLMRAGQRVKPHGRIYESTGIAEVEAVDSGVATVMVVQLFDAVTVGDIAVPEPEFNGRVGVFPTASQSRLEGTLIAFEEPHTLQSEQDFAFVDLGRAAGLVEGDVLEAVLAPERRPWGVRPEIVVARLQVVRAAERTAAVRVTDLEHPALETGLRVRLIAKMPQP